MVGRILVIDDGGAVVRLVRACLQEGGYDVLVANDGEMALRTLRRERPDLVLLDLAPSECDDREENPGRLDEGCLAAMPIVRLAARLEERGGSPGLDMGAGGVVIQSLDPGDLVACVRAVLRQAMEVPRPPASIQVGRVRVDLDGHQVQVAGRPVHLTPTEFALLRALAEQPGHALTRQEMIENGLGYRYEGLERTVDSHVKNLRRKLDEAGQAAHQVETVFGIGYRLITGNRA